MIRRGDALRVADEVFDKCENVNGDDRGAFAAAEVGARIAALAPTDAFVVAVSNVKEHEDGSATYSFELNEDAQKGLCKLGLEFMLYCAAYELDLGYVLDNLKRLKDDPSQNPV